MFHDVKYTSLDVKCTFRDVKHTSLDVKYTFHVVKHKIRRASGTFSSGGWDFSIGHPKVFHLASGTFSSGGWDFFS